MLVRVFWQPERFGAFPTCWKIYVPTCFLPPVSGREGGGGPHVPQKTHPKILWVAAPAGSALSLSLLLEVTPASLRPDPPYARPAGPRVERKRRELPAPALGSGHWSGRGVRGAGRSGGEESQGPGRRGEPGTPVTWAAPPREALGRAGAKHKQTHARPPPARPPLCRWGLQAAH